MSRKPQLPAGKQLPDQVNDWVHAPDHTRNGHVWVGENAERSVTVFQLVGKAVRVAVYDDRVSGPENCVDVVDRREDDLQDMDANQAVWWAIEQAVEWMERHKSSEWKHPDVVPAVFDAPTGFELSAYNIGQRYQTVYYEQTNDVDALEMLGDEWLDSEPSLDTRKYLYIKTWNGSGNSTIALAPWLRAHDHEIDEIVDPPEECGLTVAVKKARQWVAEQHTNRSTSTESDSPPMIGETVDSHEDRDLVVVPTDDSTIEGWNVDGNCDGSITAAQTEQELVNHLPNEWEITKFDLWGPHRTNHGGSVHYQVHIEHTSGAELQLRPETTWPDNDSGKTVYNSHELTKIGFDGSRENLLSADILHKLSTPAAVFKPLVQAATRHEPQQALSAYC